MPLPHSVNIVLESCVFYFRKYFSPKENKDTWLALLISFCITFFGIFVTLEKLSVIRKLKAEIIALQQNMNMLGWDVAYQHVSFNTLFFSPIMEIKNLSVYHKENGMSLTIPQFTLKPSLFSFTKYSLSLGKNQTFATAANNWTITTPDTKLSIQIDNKRIKQWEARFNKTNIKNIGEIETITIAGRQASGSLAINGPETIFENHIDIQNISLNKLLKHPLGNKIEHLYLKTNTMESQDDAQTFDEWHQQGGYINISTLIINWPPFSMAAKGEFRFDNNKKPLLQLDTSSQGLLTLLNDLQENGVVERKGVFVANILLTNKAFKIKENDIASTIITPITYQDGNISIENINIGKF